MSDPCCFGCTIRNRHTSTCPDTDTCHGCLPRPSLVGVYCTHHHERVLDALIDIPDLAVRVASAPDGKVQVRRFRNSEAKEPKRTHHASPSPAWDATDEIINWAHDWAEITAEHLTHTGPTKITTIGLPVRNLTQTVAYLQAQLDRIAEAPFAHDFAHEAISHKRGLEYMAGADHLTIRFKERCPTCQQKTLTRVDGADRVICNNRDCGRVWTEAEYATFAHVVAS